jgi:hypothetical protein
VIRRHLMAPMQGHAKPGCCISNSCMKLWFEGWNVNALRPHAIPAIATPAVIAALNKRDKTSCE